MSTSSFRYFAVCPKHSDRTPSFAIYDDGHGHCFVCSHHDNHVAESAVRPNPRPRYTGPLPWSMVTAYEQVLQGPMRSRIGWLWGRGLRPMTIEKLHLGHTGVAFTIPVWDVAGNLLTVRYRRDDRLVTNPDVPKYKSLSGAKRALYGAWQDWASKTVVLCEGELDAALLVQELWLASRDDLVAVSGTGGAGALAPDVAQQLTSAKRVLVAYDRDAAGALGAQKAFAVLSQLGVRARCCTWPHQWGKDVTEVLQTVGLQRWLATIGLDELWS
jgi:hypothetical protein